MILCFLPQSFLEELDGVEETSEGRSSEQQFHQYEHEPMGPFFFCFGESGISGPIFASLQFK